LLLFPFLSEKPFPEKEYHSQQNNNKNHPKGKTPLFATRFPFLHLFNPFSKNSKTLPAFFTAENTILSHDPALAANRTSTLFTPGNCWPPGMEKTFCHSI